MLNTVYSLFKTDDKFKAVLLDSINNLYLFDFVKEQTNWLENQRNNGTQVEKIIVELLLPLWQHTSNIFNEWYRKPEKRKEQMEAFKAYPMFRNIYESILKPMFVGTSKDDLEIMDKWMRLFNNFIRQAPKNKYPLILFRSFRDYGKMYETSRNPPNNFVSYTFHPFIQSPRYHNTEFLFIRCMLFQYLYTTI